MFERLFLESGKYLACNHVSSIGADVVDESRTITIPVLIPEGKAEIVSVTAPSTFTPGVSFTIATCIQNTSTFADDLFIRLTDIDTGEILGYRVTHVSGGGVTYLPVVIMIVQDTDFHCLIEAGHVE